MAISPRRIEEIITTTGSGARQLADILADRVIDAGGVTVAEHMANGQIHCDLAGIDARIAAAVTALKGGVSTDRDTFLKLSDAIDAVRAPMTEHATQHAEGGIDPVTPAMIGAQPAGNYVNTTDIRMSDARTPKTHNASHKHGGTDEIATVVAVPNGIPKADTTGKLDVAWIPPAIPANHSNSHGTTGTDPLTPADIGAQPAGNYVLATDGRLSDTRVPKAHATVHQHNGTDEIATAVAAPNAIPKANDTGKLDAAWIPFTKPAIATEAECGIVKPDTVTTAVSAAGTLYVVTSVDATPNSIVKRDSTGTIVGSITGHATWADLAEVYRSDCTLSVGDVVSVATDGDADITMGSVERPVLGVISERPGVLLNTAIKDTFLCYPVARVGIVPVRVRGTVRKGDRLTAGPDGSAVVSMDDTGFAYALEHKTTDIESMVRCVL